MGIEQQIEKAKRKDKEAFTSLVQFYKQDVYKIAKTRLHTQEDIEDAIQETMLEAYRNIHKLKKNEMFKSWIIKILINKCNKIYRKNKIIPLPIEQVDTEIEIQENEVAFDNLLKPLKYEARIIMVLYYALEYTTKEISIILDKNENTVKTIIRRSKEKIKRELEVKS